MMKNELEIKATADGSPTVYNPAFQSAYHSMHGAITESKHVFIKNGLEKIVELGVKDIYIFEMGFGTGFAHTKFFNPRPDKAH